MLEVVKTLFYTGKFTFMLQKLFAYSSGKYFLDAVHLMIILNDLGLIKTKYKLTELIYKRARGIENLPHEGLNEYTHECLDF
jgi:hypothetical protein